VSKKVDRVANAPRLQKIYQQKIIEAIIHYEHERRKACMITIFKEAGKQTAGIQITNSW
jgi:hypothetical protein